MCLVTVIIPVKNGAATLKKCLAAIRNQTIADKIEILILDSNSSDNSKEIATDFGVKVISIDPTEFNHGLTRNVGAKHAKGILLYYTVQDAYLAEVNQLEKMVDHFKDEELQAVVGIQAIPNEVDKNPAKWFKRISEPITAFKHFPNGTFLRLSMKERLSTFNFWDDVNAMYRKVALEAVPFIKTDFAEDKFWAKEALEAGMKIAFDPRLVVYHYHHSDFKYSFRLHYILNYSYYRFWKVYPRLSPFLVTIIRYWYRIWKNKELTFKNKVYWSYYNFSSEMASYLSLLTFIAVGKIFGEKKLEKTFIFFCKKVPQGSQKKI